MPNLNANRKRVRCLLETFVAATQTCPGTSSSSGSGSWLLSTILSPFLTDGDMREIHAESYAGFLAGGWGNCLVEATIQEHTHGNFGQAGQVIDFLSSSGHQRYMKAADKLERLTHRAMRAGGIQSVNLPRSEHPQAWGTRGQDVPQVTATRASSSSSSSSTGSSSSGSWLFL
eukprot:g19385.t1